MHATIPILIYHTDESILLYRVERRKRGQRERGGRLVIDACTQHVALISQG
jgi:hypothetical protein